MFLVDPPPTAADLHFRLFGYPVRVTPWFWVAAVILSLGGNSSPEWVLTWVVVVFVSILVHELGHAVVIRRFGGRPRITLYHFGGLALDDHLDRSPGEQIAISFAGPAAGFVLAGLVTLLLELSDTVDAYQWGIMPVVPDRLEPTILDYFVWDLLYVNFAWGLINLLPIYPLDGGRISREIWVELDARRGVVRSLWLSVITAIVVAVYALVEWNTLFVPVMFGMLAYGSYQMLQAYASRGW